MKVPPIIRNLSLRQVVYPALLFVFTVIVLVVFVFAAKTLTSELNRVFIVNVTENGFMIDNASYVILAQKLNLPALDTESTDSIEKETESESASQEDTSEESPVPQPLDTTDLSIAIYNATGISGLAGQLKADLESKGFVVTEVGNTAVQSENTIALKVGKKEYASLLAPNLDDSFTVIDPLPEDALFDCIITIGAGWQ